MRKKPEDMTPLDRLILAHKDANQRKHKRSPCLLQDAWTIDGRLKEDEDGN